MRQDLVNGFELFVTYCRHQFFTVTAPCRKHDRPQTLTYRAHVIACKVVDGDFTHNIAYSKYT